MHIAVDLRSVQSRHISGVENFTWNLLDKLLTVDKKNSYTLFYNSFKKNQLPEYRAINSKTYRTRIPNKILNLSFKTGLLNFEKLIGPFDCLFMPNLNQFNINPNTRLALVVHDLSPLITPEFYNLKRKLWHSFLNYKQAFNRADIIFAVSEYTKKDLIKFYNLPEEKIKVVYPGLDHYTFRPQSIARLKEIRNRYGLPGDFILFLNTIEPRKNLDGLIKAFEALKHPAFLVIAGKKGWKYRRFMDIIRNSKKSSKIKYLGYIKEADKPAIIGLARVLVYPSLYEGFGFQPLEAAACGTPVVAGNVTAMPEIIGEAALLANPYNHLELAKVLEKALTDENLRKRMIERGFEKAKEFDWEFSAHRVLKELNALA